MNAEWEKCRYGVFTNGEEVFPSDQEGASVSQPLCKRTRRKERGGVVDRLIALPDASDALILALGKHSCLGCLNFSVRNDVWGS